MRKKLSYYLVIIILALSSILLYNNYKKGNNIIWNFRGGVEQIHIDWLISSIDSIYQRTGEFPDNIEDILKIVKQIGQLSESDFNIIKKGFKDPFSGENYKIIKLIDNNKCTAFMILSSGYGGKFANKINEIDIKDSDKIKLYKNNNEDASLYLGSFIDFIKRDKDILVKQFSCDH